MLTSALQGIVPTTIIVMSVLGLSSVDFETNAAATRRDRRTMQMSTMRFESGKTTVMSLPGLTTDNTTSGGSYPTTNDSMLAMEKDSSQTKLPEIVESQV